MWYVIHGLSEAAEIQRHGLQTRSARYRGSDDARANVLEQAGDSEAACQILARAPRITNPTPAFALLNGRMGRRRGNVPEALSTVFAVLNTANVLHWTLQRCT